MKLLTSLQSILLTFLLGYTCILGGASASNIPQLNLDRHQQAVFSITSQMDDAYGTGGLMSSIVLKESSLCQQLHNPKVDKNAWGCGQLHVDAVRDVARINVTAEQLMKNPRLNLELTSYIIRECLRRFPDNVYRAIMCYKVGYQKAYFIDQPEKLAYPNEVMLLRAELIQYYQHSAKAPAAPTPSALNQQQPLPRDLVSCIQGTDETSEDSVCQGYILGQTELLDGPHLMLAPKEAQKLEPYGRH